MKIEDRFYFMQQFKITDLPSTLMKNSYSENLMVTIGRKGLHIYDVDKEEWIMNLDGDGYNYEGLHAKLTQIGYESSDSDVDILNN